MMNKRGFLKRFFDDVRTTVNEPDFWPMFGLFVGLLAMFAIFFWLAVGFDALNGFSTRWRGACRKLGDWQSFILFVSPFAIGLSAMVAGGELISQLERRNRWGKPMSWIKIGWTFGLAIGMLSGVGGLMMFWC